MKEFVVGFAFTGINERDLLMVKKNRPEWQAGKFNGVGGHVEEGETMLEAMAREFYEETGIESTPAKWLRVCTLVFPEARIGFFRSNVAWNLAFEATNPQLYGKEFPTDEPVCLMSYDRLPHNMIPNLKWIIPMAKHLDLKEYNPPTIEGMWADG